MTALVEHLGGHYAEIFSLCVKEVVKSELYLTDQILVLGKHLILNSKELLLLSSY